jgi:hypothetical protein
MKIGHAKPSSVARAAGEAATAPGLGSTSEPLD